MNWDTMTHRQIKKEGMLIPELETVTPRTTYIAYQYKGYFVQVDVSDNEITAVFKDNKIVWLHKKTKIGLNKLGN